MFFLSQHLFPLDDQSHIRQIKCVHKSNSYHIHIINAITRMNYVRVQSPTANSPVCKNQIQCNANVSIELSISALIKYIKWNATGNSYRSNVHRSTGNRLDSNHVMRIELCCELWADMRHVLRCRISVRCAICDMRDL